MAMAISKQFAKVFRMIKNVIRKFIAIRQWKKRNTSNETAPNNLFEIENVVVGTNTYGRIEALTYNYENKLIIGNYCSIGPKVAFMVSADHYSNHISTFPFKVKITKEATYEAVSKGDILVDDDVWIGYGATIMSGVHIGQGAVVAAGAVVTKDVPPYAIVGGVPAKVIKYRFEPELIQELLKVDYSRLTKEMIAAHIDDLYAELTDAKQLEWMPKK